MVEVVGSDDDAPEQSSARITRENDNRPNLIERGEPDLTTPGYSSHASRSISLSM